MWAPASTGRGSLTVNVGHHSAFGFRDAGVGTIGDIGGHRLRRHQSRPLSHQDAHHLAAGEVTHKISRAHPAFSTYKMGPRSTP